jgi:hypothetical protein
MAALDQTRYHNTVNEIDTNNDHTDGPGASITASTGTNWADPAYDAAGNITTMPQPNSPVSSFTLKYDAWIRLVKLEDTATRDPPSLTPHRSCRCRTVICVSCAWPATPG